MMDEALKRAKMRPEGAMEFRGFVPVFILPPAVRHWPMFPIDGEVPIEVVLPGGVAVVDEINRKIILLTTGWEFICDQGSVADEMARMFGIFKSDLSPQGISHDKLFRKGEKDFVWAMPFDYAFEHQRDAGEEENPYAFAHYVATNISPDKWHSYRWKPWKYTQEDADNLFRALLLNYNHDVISKRKRRRAWLAVRLFGSGSFKTPDMVKKTKKVRRQINDYLNGVSLPEDPK